MTKILLTGGGTAGHVTPNLALVPYLKAKGYEIEYMGSYDGIEKKLVEEAGIPYVGIDSGKFRRYLSAKNLTDPYHIIHGLQEAKKYIKTNKPDLVFSKGGFVAVPVVFGAAELKVPVIIHESDLTPGLANRLCIPRAAKICFSFPETEPHLTGKGIHTGLPIRDELYTGSREKGLGMCGFTPDKPVLMVVGGSLGSVNINNAVRAALPELLANFQIAHICGKDKVDESFNGTPGYVQFEYVGEGLNDLLAMADIMISRAGANFIFEIAALCKPAILIPLGTNASRGDQILNAESFKKRGFTETLLEEDLTSETLLETVKNVYENRQTYIDAMNGAAFGNAAQKIADIIEATLRDRA